MRLRLKMEFRGTCMKLGCWWWWYLSSLAVAYLGFCLGGGATVDPNSIGGTVSAPKAREKSRGVRGHAPPGKFLYLRSQKSRFWAQLHAMGTLHEHCKCRRQHSINPRGAGNLKSKFEAKAGVESGLGEGGGPIILYPV